VGHSEYVTGHENDLDDRKQNEEDHDAEQGRIDRVMICSALWRWRCVRDWIVHVFLFVFPGLLATIRFISFSLI